MMEELAKVVRCDNSGWVTVSVELKSACNHCSSSESCGTSAVAKAFSSKTQEFSIASTEQFAEGEMLKLGLPESVILKAAALVYLLPLLGFFLFASLGQFLAVLGQVSMGFNTDIMAMSLGGVGTVTSWFIGRRYAKHIEQDAQPVIVARLGTEVLLAKSV